MNIAIILNTWFRNTNLHSYTNRVYLFLLGIHPEVRGAIPGRTLSLWQKMHFCASGEIASYLHRALQQFNGTVQKTLQNHNLSENNKNIVTSLFQVGFLCNKYHENVFSTTFYVKIWLLYRCRQKRNIT